MMSGEIKLHLDSRKRVCLSKLLPIEGVSSFRAYRKGSKIILEPLAEIPAEELWLFQDPSLLKEVREGLAQPAKHYLGSFAEHADEDV